ncbi:MAG TPA: ABC transporter substrate-binding protein, partial [Candidatus Dormibacteraeota bacterium]|nr:ABC transporter substrate-binding protein [Candidatus Dormibacteraeota bacterium]
AGILAPAAAINPLTIADPGATQLLGQVGEWLAFTDQHFNYHPWLATSWSSNADTTVWTFKLRNDVKFNNGKPMTADDVVYSFKTQSDPKNGGISLSVFGSVLVPDGVVKVADDSFSSMRHLSSTPTFTTASPPLKRTSMASTRPRSQSSISGTLGSLKAHPDIPIDHRASARTFS